MRFIGGLIFTGVVFGATFAIVHFLNKKTVQTEFLP
jgi:hypothetical protein